MPSARTVPRAPAPAAKLEPHKKPVSVITCDMEGRIETFNEGAERIFGYRADEVVGKKRVSLFSPGEIVLGHVPRWLKEASTKGAYEGDTAFLRKDGTAFAAHIRITPTFKDGQQIGYCGRSTPLEGVEPKDVWPRTGLATRIFKGVVIARLPFLTATLVPILLALAWALAEGLAVDWLQFALVLAGGLALHVAANTLNDHYDWKRGTDQANNDYFLPFTGGSRSVELGLISNRGMLAVGASALAVALGLGVALALMGRVGVLGFGLAGALLGWAYTAPPLRLAGRRGLGELDSFLNFGPLMTAGAVYGFTGHLGLDAWLVGIPVGLLTLAILWVNEFPDAPSDRATGKNHLVATLGTERARWVYPVIVFGAFGSAAALAAAGITSWWILLGFLALPLAVWNSRAVIRDYASRRLAKACAGTIGQHLVAGLAMAVGLAFLA
jgi:1,4-dihydroxy-2-naphthoate polyprenyltransferase